VGKRLFEVGLYSGNSLGQTEDFDFVENVRFQKQCVSELGGRENRGSDLKGGAGI
jgi:hypothetical protein